MELDKQESTPSKKKSKYFLICEVRKNKKNKNKDKEKKGKKDKEKKKRRRSFLEVDLEVLIRSHVRVLERIVCLMHKAKF